MIKRQNRIRFEIEITNSWDLYPIKQDTPFGPGYGTLYENNKAAGKAMITKMWRKGDFKSFLEHIKNTAILYSSVSRLSMLINMTTDI